MLAMITFMDKMRKPIRQERFSNDAKAYSVLKMLEDDSSTRGMIPANSEYINIETGEKSELYWIDRQENKWEIRLWSVEDGKIH